MTRPLLSVLGLLALVTSALLAHDMFLKLDTYFLQPNAPVTIPLLNGTFSQSENSIDRPRIADIAVVGPGGRRSFDTTVVSARNDTTFLALRTGDAGTHVIGVSTRANTIPMSGAEFHQYLKEEGLTQVSAAREKAGTARDSVWERYAKHVKAIVQVGDARSESFGTALGYPAELIAVDNPYEWKRGTALRFRAMVNGTPARGQTVITGGRTSSGARLPRRELTTGADGMVTLRPSAPGVWYLTFIHIGTVTAPEHNYESEWATLTFQLR